MKTPKQGRSGGCAPTAGSLPPVKQKRVTDYWLAYYVHPTLHLCSLCGNSGIIDTTQTAISGAGVNAGMRNFCICPNGQEMRKCAANAKDVAAAGKAPENDHTASSPSPRSACSMAELPTDSDT